MISIEKSAEDVEQDPHPTAHNNKEAAFAESAHQKERASTASGEIEETQLTEADKAGAKIHYLPRRLAREHGVNAATVLAGFAFKLKYHKKNEWNGRWWYYDTLETLVKRRWPYFSESGLWHITEYLANDAELLIKDCNNTLTFDRTSWYAMEDPVRDAALTDLLWFDVSVAKKHGVPAALIYHNLRYHLREELKENPDCIIPYHRLNIAKLARDLPLSRSTIRRAIGEMETSSVILRHPMKRKLFTLADAGELTQNGSTSERNGSFSNGSFSNRNGSDSETIGSFSETNGSNSERNGSNSDDYTQYETNRKTHEKDHSRNHSQSGVSVDACEDADDIEKQPSAYDNAHNAVRSAAAPAKETTEAHRGSDVAAASTICDSTSITTFEQLVHQAAIAYKAIQSLEPGTRQSISDSLAGVSYLVEQHLSAEDIIKHWRTTDRDGLVRAFSSCIARLIQDDLDGYKAFGVPDDQLWPMLYYPQLETLIRAFSDDEIWTGKHTHTIKSLKDDVAETHSALIEKVESATGLSPQAKCSLVKQAIMRRNQYGWTLSDDSKQMNVVQPSTAGLKKLEELFAKQPQLSAVHILDLLGECVDTYFLQEVPDGFDPHWAVRQGKDLEKLVRYSERIVRELDCFEVCPIGAA
jgi:hypothetical protein